MLHRHVLPDADRVVYRGIPVTRPAATLIDLARHLGRGPLERAISEADKRDLVDPDSLYEIAVAAGRRRGAARLRRLLADQHFRLTDSELERRFLAIVRAAGLPMPLTRVRVCGFVVDFYWPELGIVVETDGLRYHRTPQQQSRDQLRDHALAAADIERLRFSHLLVAREPAHVAATLRTVARRRGLAA